MAEDWDRLVSELKSLRQRRGLSLQVLSKCPTVLAALNHPPLQEAYDMVAKLVQGLGDDERAVALRHAYAIGMSEPRLLMARRAELQALTGRDLKTIAGYEDQMIEELASRILGATRPEVSDSHVFVVGELDGRRLVRVAVTVRFPSERGGDSFERTVDYENQSEIQSLPALLYQLPHDWEPLSLTLGLRVPVEPVLTYWATAATELLGLMFGERGSEVPIRDGQVMMHVEGPKPGDIYGVYWVG